ncbi:PREDICTED: elicitor-responsive protein 3 [Nelumbo nucifera]|uniref:Elicitor-responsive protein 3 n=1 Tax=Nelumbo nucifera TaxID=4432 RepID=A0A1U7YSD6_NELNU|nr:PREDICTED: elicitor-responsive protein 3 [Nelumbo nucifera]
MKGGILEVVLVSAKGIRHTNFVGKPGYYVIIQCGTQTHRSKNSPGEGRKVLWNEKFIFKFASSELQELTYLKLRIMDKEMFTEGGFVGETLIHLGGILTEGNNKGFIQLKPSPYNVVLEDDSYKGEIKIGLKFIANVELQTEMIEYEGQEKKPPQSIYRTILNYCQISWWRFFFFHKKSDDKQMNFCQI